MGLKYEVANYKLSIMQLLLFIFKQDGMLLSKIRMLPESQKN